MTYKLYYDQRHTKQDGTCHIKVYVCMNNLHTYLPTGICVTPDQFNPSGGRNGTSWVSNHRNSIAMNNHLRNYLADVERAMTECLDIARKRPVKTLKQFKKILQALIEPKDGEGNPSLNHYFKACIETKTGRTKEIYSNTLQKLSQYTDMESLYIEDIDIDWLSAWECHMKGENNAVNTISIEMRNLRHVLRYAIARNKTLAQYYPFDMYKIKRASTPNLSLTIEQLATLRDWPCKNKQDEKSRDMFLLSFYLLGINFGDLALSTDSNVVNNRLMYKRNKTHRDYSVLIYPEAWELINKYKGKDYLINLCDKGRNYKDELKKTNTCLKQISRDIEEYLVKKWALEGKNYMRPTFPRITTYWARYTWANVAHRLRIPKDNISMALGHSFGNKTTDTYIAYDLDQVDEANMKVIEYLGTFGYSAQKKAPDPSRTGDSKDKEKCI